MAACFVRHVPGQSCTLHVLHQGEVMSGIDYPAGHKHFRMSREEINATGGSSSEEVSAHFCPIISWHFTEVDKDLKCKFPESHKWSFTGAWIRCLDEASSKETAGSLCMHSCLQVPLVPHHNVDNAWPSRVAPKKHGNGLGNNYLYILTFMRSSNKLAKPLKHPHTVRVLQKLSYRSRPEFSDSAFFISQLNNKL